MNNKEKILKTLNDFFGHDDFRQGQEELILNIVNGKDTLGIMPTGGGKSICFQIPGLLFDGVTVVISPLISLMKDQVHNLTQKGIPSVFINSSLTPKQTRLAYQGIEENKYKFIYLAPERLTNEDFLKLVPNIDISLLAVDEAHCVSQWGHDFRTSYSKIPNFYKKLKRRPIVVGFSATATPTVQKDIISKLEMVNPFVQVSGFRRTNLDLSCIPSEKRSAQLKRFLKEHQGQQGIIYCISTKEVENFYEKYKNKMKIGMYHGKMKTSEKNLTQEAFLNGEIDVVVATSAFGMGIDKPNIRYIVHYQMPKDLESYYQEIGRAGRDGKKAKCVLFFSKQDKAINLFLINEKRGYSYSPAKLEAIRVQKEKLETMEHFCKTKLCLHSFILTYFGEKDSSECGNKCSSCKGGEK